MPEQPAGWRAPLACVALAAMVFAVFAQTFRDPFVNFDDNDYIYENPVVSAGLTRGNLAWAFSFHAFNWHPLTWLSHMLDCQLYGLNPAGHHVTSVILHMATVIALFLVLRNLTGAFWPSAFSAAVFAIHPLRVESVAWVAERKDVLSGFFFVLTIGAYARYVRRQRAKGAYVLSLLLFALGLMAKPMLVSLPVVLLLLDYWPLRRGESWGRLMLEKLPFFALAAASCALTLCAQQAVIHLGWSIPLPLRCANAVVSSVIYLGQLFWPAGLVASYPFPFHGIAGWKILAAAAALTAFTALAIWQRRKRPWLLVGWLWYLVMLLPVLGIIQVGRQAHADRYTYLPEIGICMALIWLVADWKFRRWMAAAGVGIIGVLMFCAWRQAGYWKDSTALWIHALACTEDNDVAHFALGNDFFEHGDLPNAVAHFEKSIAINPNHPEVQYNLGTALNQMGRTEDAIAGFKEALRIRPEYEEALNNLGTAYLNEGRLDEAIAQLQHALKLRPNAAAAHSNLGIVYLRKGETERAMEQFRRALQLKPRYASAHYNLGAAFSQLGKYGKAIAEFQAALQLTPDDTDTLDNLAWLLATAPEATLRDGGRAVTLARRANDLTGGRNPLRLHTLAAALAEAGKFAEAATTIQTAIRMARDSGQMSLVDQFSGELKCYEAGLPLHGQPIMDGQSK